VLHVQLQLDGDPRKNIDRPHHHAVVNGVRCHPGERQRLDTPQLQGVTAASSSYSSPTLISPLEVSQCTSGEAPSEAPRMRRTSSRIAAHSSPTVVASKLATHERGSRRYPTPRAPMSAELRPPGGVARRRCVLDRHRKQIVLDCKLDQLLTEAQIGEQSWTLRKGVS